jgi:DNA-binding XRE family transcriptional regulator
VLLGPVEECFLAVCESDPTTANRVMEAIDHLAEAGPGLGRPLVDRIHGSRLHNLEQGEAMTGRRWSEVKAEAVARQPWLASDEAREQRAEIRAEDLGRVRGHELAEMRKSAGLTQVEVAAILGVSQARISQIEHGQVDSLDTLRAYAEALGGEVSIVVSRGPLTLRVA